MPMPWRCAVGSTSSSMSRVRIEYIGVRRRAVDVVEVDVVGAEPTQRVLDLVDDPASGATALVGVLAHRHEELGGERDIVTAALEGLADDLLRLASRVDVGGVNEVDALVQGGLDDADRVVVVGVAPGAEHHR